MLGDFDALQLLQDPILAWAAVWAFIAVVCLGVTKNPRDERVPVLLVSALFLIMLDITLSIFGLKPGFFPSNYAGGVIIVFGTVLCYCKTIQVLNNYLAPPAINACTTHKNIVLPSALVLMHVGLALVSIAQNQYTKLYFVPWSFLADHNYLIGIVLFALMLWLLRFVLDCISLAQHKNSCGYTLWLKTTSFLTKLTSTLSPQKGGKSVYVSPTTRAKTGEKVPPASVVKPVVVLEPEVVVEPEVASETSDTLALVKPVVGLEPEVVVEPQVASGTLDTPRILLINARFVLAGFYKNSMELFVVSQQPMLRMG